MQYERLQSNDNAEQVWAEAVGIAESEIDELQQDRIWTVLAVAKIQAGHYEQFTEYLSKIVSKEALDDAWLLCSSALSSKGKHAEAIALADMFEKYNPDRFFAMEKIAIDAALAGDYILSAQAARGMDPINERSMWRKLPADAEPRRKAICLGSRFHGNDSYQPSVYLSRSPIRQFGHGCLLDKCCCRIALTVITPKVMKVSGRTK